MSKDRIKAIHRLKEYVQEHNMTQRDLERKLDLCSGYIWNAADKDSDIGEGILYKLKQKCPDVSIDWLVTGEEPELKSGDDSTKTDNQVPTGPTSEDIKNALASSYEFTLKSKDETIMALTRKIAELQAELNYLKK